MRTVPFWGSYLGKRRIRKFSKEPETMPQFKSREEYERWRAERMGGQGEGPQTQDQEERLQKPEPPEKVQTSQIPRVTRPPQRPHMPQRPQPPPSDTGFPLTGKGLRSVGELFRDTWGLFKTRFLTLICLYLLSVLFIVIAVGMVAGSGFLLVSVLPISKNILIGGLIAVGLVIGSIAMSWGMAAFTIATVDDDLGIREALGMGWERVWRFIWVYSLFGFIVGGGFLLFLIPGMIFLIWFLFSAFVVVAEEEKGMGALLKSKEYVKSNWFAVFLRAFVIWLVSVGLSVIPVLGPILSLLFIPFMMLFIRLVYDDLRGLKGKATLYPSMGTKFKWIGTGALGYAVFPVILFFMMGASLTGPLLAVKGMLSNSEKRFKSTQKKATLPFRMESGTPRQAGAEDSRSQLQSEGSPWSEAKKPEATGEAVIVRDGVREIFVLQTGFFSETRMANPSRASIQFQIPAEKHSNARRIEMLLDATKVGEHTVDGNFVRDAFMGRSGEPSEQEYQPKFLYIADGGQVFFPEDSCTVIVTSPYDATPEGVFAGEVKECIITSPGIHHTLSAQFKMVGVSSR